MTGSRSGIMKGNLILPPLHRRYQVTALQHISLNHHKSFLFRFFLTVFKLLLSDLFIGNVLPLPVGDINLQLFVPPLLLIEQLKQNRHNMLATRAGIGTITLTGDSTAQDNFCPIISIIAIDFIHIPAIPALLMDTAERSVFVQKLTTFENYR
jgi:hypothetical protein